MRNIFISAGEVSGDIYGARVLEEFKVSKSSVSFFGMGGQAMEAAGANIIANPLGDSNIGFSLSLKDIKKYYKLAHGMVSLIREKECPLALLIDFSGYHMYLGRLLSRENITVIHYIPPGVWFWGRWRASFLARHNILAATIFPAEQKIYEEKGAKAFFVGHPLGWDLANFKDIPKEENLIALLPGSRTKEVAAHLPEIFKAVELLKEKHSHLKFSLALLSEPEDELVKKAMELGVDIVYNGSRRLLARASLGIVASGTATLEAGLLKTPAVIIYKIDKRSYALGRILAKVTNIGLPNLILGEEVFPELLQEKVRAENIYQEIIKFLEPDYRQIILDKLETMSRLLGKDNPARAVADLLMTIEGRNQCP